MEAFKKIINPGRTIDGPVFVKIEWDGKRLSLSGVIGPKSNGDTTGSCGQIADEFRYSLTSESPGWDQEMVQKLVDLWGRWHLNDLKAGCEHQRAEGWDRRPIDPLKPLNAYGKHFEGQRSSSWNMLVWVTRDEHPQGLLGYPCPACGYPYGTQWLHEDVPEEVLVWLHDLPDTTVQPAWV